MAELRYNPFKNDWVMVASDRQNRPQMPKDWCPFCPGSGRVPDSFDVLKYDNDFPALSMDPPKPDDVATDFFKTENALWQVRGDFVFFRSYCNPAAAFAGACEKAH